MKIHFYKYQGTGNDFVILNNLDGKYSGLTEAQVAFLCHRRFGIGADGLMLLNNLPPYDFEMKYYNADGHESSMCGNGGRCLVQAAYDMGIIKTSYRFTAPDGEHEASIKGDGTVSLKMNDVKEIEEQNGNYIVDTGSPHFVLLDNDIESLDVFRKGRDIRYSPPFKKEGINVNFVEQMDDSHQIKVRTYERGVEDETYSCGTGVTAAALVCSHNENGFNYVSVQTKGGKLAVEYDKYDGHFENIWLIGPAKKVFEGTIELS